jgi:hydrogenase expression/formation protein HypD
VSLAAREDLKNFSLLVSHVLVPPAIEAILADTNNTVQGFLAAGHVCAVMGIEAYKPVAAEYRVPIVVTGFEPVDILQGLYMCIRQLEEGRIEVENQYERAVRLEGNLYAQELITEVFEVIPREWRGLGTVVDSGWGLRGKYARFDAELRFEIAPPCLTEFFDCISGLVLIGQKKPNECPAFGSRCTPEHPLGATMVSDEGACAAYYRYHRGLAA